MNRRAFVIGLGAAVAAPLAIEAQQAAKVYRIGFLRAGQPPTAWIDGFQQGLREHGYVDGQNVVNEFRSTDGRVDQLPRLTEELLRSQVDVIVASAAPAALAAKKATTRVPIVFVGVNDPVALGLASSLGHPGSNTTGLATTSAALAGKRLELLRELVPKLRRVAVLWDTLNPTNPIQLKDAEEAARTLGLQTQPVPVRGPNDFDTASCDRTAVRLEGDDETADRARDDRDDVNATGVPMQRRICRPDSAAELAAPTKL
jgi:putative ABC transport system substrate-binding protein